MKQYLEQSLYEPIQEFKEDLRVYQVGNLESLSASVLYTPKISDLGGISGYGDMTSIKPIGTSNFKVYLPKSNAIGRSLKISTPNEKIIINQNKRIKGKSGVDYFNLDGTLAGRLINLNKSELDSLED